LEDKIKNGLKEMGLDGFVWIHLDEYRDNKQALVNRNGPLGLI
jgi:hypothetical protein